MKLTTGIWIFCIIVMLALTVRTLQASTGLDCDRCTVELTNSLPGGISKYTYENISIVKLIEAYKDEDSKCLFTWDPVQGYIKNGY